MPYQVHRPQSDKSGIEPPQRKLYCMLRWSLQEVVKYVFTYPPVDGLITRAIPVILLGARARRARAQAEKWRTRSSMCDCHQILASLLPSTHPWFLPKHASLLPLVTHISPPTPTTATYLCLQSSGAVAVTALYASSVCT